MIDFYERHRIWLELQRKWDPAFNVRQPQRLVINVRRPQRYLTKKEAA